MLPRCLPRCNPGALHAFVYSSDCYILLPIIGIFNMKDLLDFDLSGSARSRGQAIRHAKKRQMREKHQQQQMLESRSQLISFTFFIFFSSFFSWNPPSRKPAFAVNKQPADEHNVVQYTYDMKNASAHHEIPFSTRRPTMDISETKKPLRSRLRTLCQYKQKNSREEDEQWLRMSIDDQFDLLRFQRIKKTQYNSIQNHLLKIMLPDATRHCQRSYVKTYHNGDGNAMIKKIRSYIESNRLIIESEAKQDDVNVDWMFLERFKKDKEWRLDDFVQKSFDHEMKRLFKRESFSDLKSRMYRELQDDMTDMVSLLREQSNYPSLRALLETYERKDHFAVSRSHRMYIESRMDDIRAKARFKP